jgi:CO/xanthine dehydrogenase Mo-binding subunit
MDDGTIRIHVAAAPEAGAANQTLIEFLASALSLPSDQIDIIAGHTGERKLISLIGITPAAVEAVMVRLSQAKKVAKMKRATRVAKRSANNSRKKSARKKAKKA